MSITVGETQSNDSLTLKVSVTITMKKICLLFIRYTTYDIALCQPIQSGQSEIYKRQSYNLVALNLRAWIQFCSIHIRIQAWLWTCNPSTKEAEKGRFPGGCQKLGIVAL